MISVFFVYQHSSTVHVQSMKSVCWSQGTPHTLSTQRRKQMDQNRYIITLFEDVPSPVMPIPYMLWTKESPKFQDYCPAKHQRNSPVLEQPTESFHESFHPVASWSTWTNSCWGSNDSVWNQTDKTHSLTVWKRLAKLKHITGKWWNLSSHMIYVKQTYEQIVLKRLWAGDKCGDIKQLWLFYKAKMLTWRWD